MFIRNKQFLAEIKICRATNGHSPRLQQPKYRGLEAKLLILHGKHGNGELTTKNSCFQKLTKNVMFHHQENRQQ